MLIKENMKFKIVPENIDDTFETEILEVNDDYITFPVQEGKIKEREKFDAYMFSNDGIIFFSAKIGKIENTNAKVNLNFTPELLQRRQYARIKVDKNVKIREQDKKENIEAHLIDISVGGFRFTTKEAINEEAAFILDVNLNNNNMELPFSPINVVEEENNTYTISARFENIQNTDKIALVQYCYKKQAEDIEE